MALTGPQSALLGIADRWGYQVAAAVQAMSGGTRVWQRTWDAADETFCNYVCDTQGTDLDNALKALPLGDVDEMKTFVRLLSEYAVKGLGYNSVDAWLAALRVRIDQRAAACLSALGAFSVANMHASADVSADAPGLVMGTLAQGGALVAGTDIAATVAAASIVQGRVTAIGTADWTLSVTLERADASTEVISQVIKGTTGGGAVGDVYALGQQAISGAAAAGQKVVPVATTAQFEVGQIVVLNEWTGTAPDEVWTSHEVATIASIQTDASLTMASNLLHTYTSSGYAYPCWTGVSAASGSGGTAGDAVTFGPRADRRLRL